MKLTSLLSLSTAASIMLGCRVEAETFVVVNVNGSGEGSLRQAIVDANNAPGQDSIVFNIPGSGTKTIVLGSALPAITEPVVIDGTTQTGYAGTPLIELNGANAGTSPGLRLLAGRSTVTGFCINRFAAQGIEISGPGTNLLVGNFIGTDTSGTLARANDLQGIWLNNSCENVISNNLVSANGESGIYLLNGGRNSILGNLIGVSIVGTNRLANGGNGISVNGSGANQIGSLVSSNVIAGNSGSGIAFSGIASAANLVQGNFIGVGSDGSKVVPNTGDGIAMVNARGNIIGGANVISGNGKAGVSISSSSITNVVKGNCIGTDFFGSLRLGNNYAGVTIARATNNTIGGNTADERNIISGNGQDGVYLSTNAVGNTIAGNFIGLGGSGASGLSNAYDGITISSAHSNVIGGNVISGNGFDGIGIIDGSSRNLLVGNFIGTDAVGGAPVANKRAGIGISRSPSNIIGGSWPSDRNVISGNGDAGIYIVGTGATGNTVNGNLIGTDASGMLPLGNYSEGIYLRTSGASAIDNNIISANGTWGISLTNTDNNIIRGNTIGTALDRTTPLGNATRIGSGGNRFHSIELSAGCSGNTIGGVASGSGNLVAYTPSQGGVNYAGIRVRDGATNNPILGNTFKGNAGLAIDLGGYLVTQNDVCDADAGANQLQNFPVISRSYTGGGTIVQGSLDARPNTTYRLEFFASSDTANFGVGEGEIYLGSKEVTTGSACSTEFTAVLAVPVPEGYRVCATTTDPNNNTSEFSVFAEPQPAPSVSALSSEPGTLRLAWPQTYQGFGLRQTESLEPPVTWSPVDSPTEAIEGQVVVTVPQEPGVTRFYQLVFE